MKLHHSKTFAGSAALMIGAALLLSGCSSSTPTAVSPSATSPASTAPYSEAPSSTTPSSPVAGTPDLKTEKTAKGTVVADGKGMSLYFFANDTKDTKASACTGACMDAWPIAVASSETPKVEGITGKVGTIASPDGKLQLTLNGMPLYTFAQDSKPGDILGQGIKGVWYLASPDGSMIK